MPIPFIPSDEMDGGQELIPDQDDDIGRQNRGQLAHLLDDRERVGEEAVEQHNQPQQREQGKEAVKGDSCRNERDIVVPCALVGPR